MKKLIRATTDNSNIIKFEIILDLNVSANIAAAYNPDFSEVELDEDIDFMQEEAYDSFMLMVFQQLERLGFEHLEPIRKSNNPNSKSRYFTFCKKDDYNNLTVELVIYLRISDHRLTKRNSKNKNWDRYEATKAYHNKDIENYRILNENHPEDVSFTELTIIINNNKFRGYSEALNYIKNQVKYYLK